MRFLQLLRQNGYGDMAVEYLKILAERPDLPKDVRDLWDLEMAKSLRSAAADAYDDREYRRLTEESQKHLEKFIREKPDHPAVASAMTSWGEFLGQQALARLAAARNLSGKEKQQREKHLAEAREDLKQARDKFVQAQQKYQQLLDALPPPKTAPRRTLRGKAADARAEIEANLVEARFQTAMADYYLAQTYTDPKSEERTAALRLAAKGFDDIFQKDRISGEMLSETGLRAHLWHGKTAEEMGDLRLAADIYDEVLVNASEPGERRAATGLEPLFAQVEYFRLLILKKQQPEKFLPEANVWLQKNGRLLRQTDGYQGVALEAAKAIYEQAQKAAAPEKAKGTSEALRILTEMSKVRSPHQQEAILLRRELLLASGKSDLEIATFEEALAMADAAVEDKQWRQAEDLYCKAFELFEKSNVKDEARLVAVHEALAGVRLMIAFDLYNQGKLEECIEEAGAAVYESPQRKIVRKDSDAAAQAAALAVAAAWNLYANAPEDKRPDALARLMQLAKLTEANWPDRPEADDARMARARVKLLVDQVPEAIEIFERLNPKSSRYPQAMYFAAQSYGLLYLAEKSKPEAARDQVQIAACRGKMIERLGAALEVLNRQVEPGKPLPDYFLESQLLLAQIRADGGENLQAAALYQTLIDRIKAEKRQNFDRPTVHIFLGAVKAYAALGQFDKAGEAADALIELGPDSSQVNDVLIMFAGLLDVERKKALAAVTELEATPKRAETEDAKQRLAKVKHLLGNILGKLARRKEVSLWGMVFIADGLNTVGMTAQASREYQKITKRAETDPEFAKAAKKAMTRVRAQLIGLLRKEGKFAEALQQVDQLIKDNPRALEPLMEKGRILEAWAEKEPQRYGDAVAHWVTVRNRLQPLRKKPSEYYDVMYNVAACLVHEAENSKDRATVLDRAKKAEQVLKAALILSPRLNGPDSVARYNVLLNKAITMQGRSPE